VTEIDTGDILPRLTFIQKVHQQGGELFPGEEDGICDFRFKNLPAAEKSPALQFL
jgi:hypothetical protein